MGCHITAHFTANFCKFYSFELKPLLLVEHRKNNNLFLQCILISENDQLLKSIFKSFQNAS